jgi:hypothetical protein
VTARVGTFNQQEAGSAPGLPAALIPSRCDTLRS